MKNNTQTLIRGSLLILVIGGLVALGMQHSALARLRTEHDTLVSQSREAEQLAAENAQLGGLRDQKTELEKLREANQDLPELRNEVGQLRKAAAELEKLRAENQQLRTRAKAASERATSGGSSATLPGFISRASLRNAGMNTPEDTAQTMFWAMTQGNVEVMAQCTGQTDKLADQATLNQMQAQREDAVQQFSGFPGFAVVAKTNLAPDEVSLSLQTGVGGAPLTMKFKDVAGQWQLER
jgi:myosin heavy subunit